MTTGERLSGVVAELRRRIGAEQVRTGVLHRHAYAHDASHYQLIPEVVVIARTTEDVSTTLTLARDAGIPVTFRSGGTSLSGQASGGGILIDTRRGFRRISVSSDGGTLTAEPGATLRAANLRLLRHGRQLGPDPASEVACTIGGIIANNSSGMAAGTTQNSYRTLISMTAVLTSGTVIDTAAPDADAVLRAKEPELVGTLMALRDRARAQPRIVQEIRERYAMKNTMGYGVNTLLDFDTPADILARLLIGSEGTLGFVSEAVFATVPVRPLVATGLAIFPSVDAAVTALPELIGSGASTLELLDAASLRVARTLRDAPQEVFGFDIDRHAALLIEYRAETHAQLREQVSAAEAELTRFGLTRAPSFTEAQQARAALWQVRKGLYAAVAEARPSGTTAILEDIVVPVPALPRVCANLSALLERYGYDGGVIFGHAKDGNLHFMLTDRFSDPAAVERFAAFTDDMSTLVLEAGGNLKAEHGTGRAMAPYLSRQYSPELVQIMHEIKAAFDPEQVLNPGVLIPLHGDEHLRNLKPVTSVESEVDRCVECGYCEPACPSKDLTLTPRQRIVVRRAQAHAEQEGNQALADELGAAYRYAGVDSCAVDGMCAVACPVGINTGDLVRRLRRESATGPEQQGWAFAAKHWKGVTRAAGVGLDVASALPAAPVQLLTRAARRIAGADTIPSYTADLPGGGAPRSRLGTTGRTGTPAAAVFLPSCQGAMFAATGDGAQTAFMRLCEAAGIGLIVPEGIDELCCGTPWSSKGYAAGHAEMSERVLAAVAEAQRSAGAQLPVVIDASSCTEGVGSIMAAARAAGDERAATVTDAVAFTEASVLPRLPALPEARMVDRLMLHPTCSSTQLGLNGSLQALGEAFAHEVLVPDDWGCCAFAGDRGMLHPELTASATRAEAAEVARAGADEHASCNRACEIGMSRATGRPYHHVLELLARAYGLDAQEPSERRGTR